MGSSLEPGTRDVIEGIDPVMSGKYLLPSESGPEDVSVPRDQSDASHDE
ncbi:hypothetical protein [Halalkalicoccus salilacus]